MAPRFCCIIVCCLLSLSCWATEDLREETHADQNPHPALQGSDVLFRKSVWQYQRLLAEGDRQGAVLHGQMWLETCRRQNDGIGYYQAALLLSRQTPLLLSQQEIAVAFYNAAQALRSQPREIQASAVTYENAVAHVAYNWPILFESGLQALEEIYHLHPQHFLGFRLSEVFCAHIHACALKDALIIKNKDFWRTYQEKYAERILHSQLNYFGMENRVLTAAIRFYVLGDRQSGIAELKWNLRQDVLAWLAYVQRSPKITSQLLLDLANLVGDVNQHALKLGHHEWLPAVNALYWWALCGGQKTGAKYLLVMNAKRLKALKSKSAQNYLAGHHGEPLSHGQLL
ncbi:MAG: hypothetical protein ACK5O7_06250 [Holosporales bacterium]